MRTKAAAAALAAAVTVAAQELPRPAASFEAFLAGVRAEALERGLSAATLDAALGGLEPLPVVVARDRTQPEATQSLDAYVAQRVNAQRIATGRARLAEHADILRRVEQVYGLPPATMVAIWGIESNFGAFTGTYPTIAALATLAYDARRPLFRAELLEALRIVDRGLADAGSLKGSWAGAMGQPQFMPSSYLTHAVDFDGDGRPDIWSSLPDVFASMANYLKNAGWQRGERWGREVRIGKAVMATIDRTVPMRSSGCRAVRDMTVARPLADWTNLGVRLADGRPLPAADMPASLVRGQSRHFLVYRNYLALIGYNCSHAYAVTVGLLADSIQHGPRAPHVFTSAP